MPFRITQEMRRAREAELAFGEAVRLARFRELTEQLTRIAYPGRDPLPYRPSFAKNALYAMAEETWGERNWESYKRLVDYLMVRVPPGRVAKAAAGIAKGATAEMVAAEIQADLALALENQLRITFEGRPRYEWWREPSGKAAIWMRNRVLYPSGKHQVKIRSFETMPRGEDGEQDPFDIFIPPFEKHKLWRGYVEPEIREFLSMDALERVLTPRQFEVARAYIEGWDERHWNVTEEIAERLGITPAAVRWHARAAQENEQLDRMVDSVRIVKKYQFFR